MMVGILSSVCAIVVAYFVTRRVTRTHPAPHHAKLAVREAMYRTHHAVAPGDSLGAAARCLVETGQHPLPIVDHGETVGVLTRCDVATGINQVGAQATVAAAPHHDAITIAGSESVDDLADRLAKAPDAIAVVIDDGAPVGVVTAQQLATFVALHER